MTLLMGFKKVRLPKPLPFSLEFGMETVREDALCWGMSGEGNSSADEGLSFSCILARVGSPGLFTP